MSGNLVWLSSYPKSGNTWMRLLLSNYFSGQDTPTDINALDVGPIASARSVFDDYVGIQASDLTDDEIERLRPRVYEYVSRQAGELDVDGRPRFIKVHDAYTHTSEDTPLFPSSATAGVVYLLRNPLDVLVSFAHHSGATLEQTARRMGNPQAQFLSQTNKMQRQLRQRLLTWSEHVTSWVDQPDLAVLPVRYEDLSTSTHAEFAKVLDLIGVAPEPDIVDRAVSFASFDNLQAQEAKDGFSERPVSASRFFRSGRVGDWRSQLSPELVEQICADHGEVMHRFGYLVDGAPV